MPPLYPGLAPYEHGLLDVGDGNSIYWECSGNPKGKPAVYVHGGPGSGSTAGARRFFNPDAYRIVLFDQRNCGRSSPLLTTRAQLAANTTPHLIRDLESLRTHLSIERWAMLGSSWGTTLALAYAERHPERVSALVLACVTTTSRREVDWITTGVRRLFPEQWERFALHIPRQLRHERIVDAYATLLFDEDPAISAAAAAEWCAWEDAHVSLTPGYRPNARFFDADYRLRFARMVTHYWQNSAFLADNQLIREAGSLNRIRGVLIHGKYDVSSPLETAWQLHRAWPASELQVANDAGHGDGSIFEKIVNAMDGISSLQ